MDIKYTHDGFEVGWVGSFDGATFVRFIYRSGDEEWLGNPVPYDGDIYDNLPTRKSNDEFIGLKRQIDAAKNELREINYKLEEARKAENWIINLSDFRNKSFWVFAEGQPLPISISTKNPDFSFHIGKDRTGNTTYTIDVSDNVGWKQTKNISRISFTEPTHEECIEWIESSLNNGTIHVNKLVNLSENLLSEDTKMKISRHLEDVKLQKINKIRNDINLLQEKLKDLSSK